MPGDRARTRSREGECGLPYTIGSAVIDKCRTWGDCVRAKEGGVGNLAYEHFVVNNILVLFRDTCSRAKHCCTGISGRLLVQRFQFDQLLDPWSCHVSRALGSHVLAGNRMCPSVSLKWYEPCFEQS